MVLWLCIAVLASNTPAPMPVTPKLEDSPLFANDPESSHQAFSMAKAGVRPREDYGEFHSSLDKDAEQVLARASAGGKYSFTSMQEYGPIKQMFREIGEGADLIERTKNFRSRMKHGKPFLTDEEMKKPMQSTADYLVRLLAGPEALKAALIPNQNNPSQPPPPAKPLMDQPVERKRKGGEDVDPFSIANVLSTLQRNGDFDDEEDSEDLEARSSRYLHHVSEHHRAHSRSHHSPHRPAAPIDQDVVDRNHLPVYNFLELSSTTSHDHHHHHTSEPAHNDTNLEQSTAAGMGTRPVSVGYDKDSMDVASEAINSARSTLPNLQGAALLMPLLVMALSGLGGSPNTDLSSSPDPFAKIGLANTPNSDRCYSMEDHWIRECASPPSVYLSLSEDILPISAEAREAGTPSVQANTNATVDNTARNKMLSAYMGKLQNILTNTGSLARPVAILKSFINSPPTIPQSPMVIGPAPDSSRPLRGVPSHILTANTPTSSAPTGSGFLSTPTPPVIDDGPVDMVQVGQMQKLLLDILKGRISPRVLMSAGKPGAPSLPQTEGSLKRLLAVMFSGAMEASKEKVTPGDEAFAGAHTTGGLSGTVGMTSGLGAMWPIMGSAAVGASSAGLMRSPDYYAPIGPDSMSMAPSEFTVSPAEQCDRLLHTWLFKCAVNPM